MAGIALFAVSDTAYLFQIANGTYQRGIVDAGWVVSARGHRARRLAAVDGHACAGSGLERVRLPRRLRCDRAVRARLRHVPSGARARARAGDSLCGRCDRADVVDLPAEPAHDPHQRHRCLHRRAHGARQPPPTARRPRGRAGDRGNARAARPGRLQGLQRHLRPPGRRRAAGPARPPAGSDSRRRRCRLQTRRGRVLRPRPRLRSRPGARPHRRRRHSANTATASRSQAPTGSRRCPKKPTTPAKHSESQTSGCTPKNTAARTRPAARAKTCSSAHSSNATPDSSTTSPTSPSSQSTSPASSTSPNTRSNRSATPQSSTTSARSRSRTPSCRRRAP